MLDLIAERLAEQLDLDAQDVTLDTNFKEDLGADSLDLMEMVMNLETEYNIEFAPEELEAIETVRDLINALDDKGVTE